MQYPNVSVIIPCFGTCRLLLHCVQCIERQHYPAEKIEIVIVDNNPTPHITKEIIQTKGKLEIFHEPMPGSYAARNRGILMSHGEVLAFTDADCAPSPQWICSAVNVLSLLNANAAIGGRILFTFRNSTGPNMWELLDSIIHLRQEDYVGRLHFAATANLIAPRESFNLNGTFNGEFLSGGDMDWGARLHSRGFPIIYCPQAVVFHPARATASALIAKNRRGVSADLTRARMNRSPRLFILVSQLQLFMSRCRILIQGARTCGCSRNCLYLMLVQLTYLYVIRCYEALRLIVGASPVR